jgi:hypothetical protein
MARIKNILKNLMYLLGILLGEKASGLLKEMIENFVEGWSKKLVTA